MNFKSGSGGKMTEKEMEQAKRAKLKREKPFVYEKVLKIADRHAAGIPTPIVDIAYSTVCNLKCLHCSARRLTPKKHKLTPEVLKNFTSQADALGLCQLNLSGGEPLLFTPLDKIFEALQPDKFHLSMSSNGHFLTLEKAKELKKMGLDKIKISLDDFDEAKHDANRMDTGAYQKAMKAFFAAQEAGLSVVVQTVVTHENCCTSRTVKMAEFCQENGFTLDVMLAKAIGAWEGKHEVLCDGKDLQFLKEVHDSIPALHLDTFPTYGIDRGCGTVDSTIHMTPYGDILPCVFIHISLGNIFEESLETILKRGKSIKHFAEYHPCCLSGMDRNFINKYMSKFYGKEIPISWKDAFTKEDFIQ